MRLVLVIALVATVAGDAAARKRPGAGDLVEFKVISQRPSAFTSRQLFATFDALIPSIEACGSLKVGKHMTVYLVKAEISADAAISAVSLSDADDKPLKDSVANECVTAAINTAKFPTPKRATKLQFALIYRK